MGLAELITLLAKVETNKTLLSIHETEGLLDLIIWFTFLIDLLSQCTDSDLIRLPEDTTLVGFTPLESKPIERIYCRRTDDIEAAQTTLRIQKILFFGTNFLCETDPPVLKALPAPPGGANLSSPPLLYVSNVLSNNLNEVTIIYIAVFIFVMHYNFLC